MLKTHWIHTGASALFRKARVSAKGKMLIQSEGDLKSIPAALFNTEVLMLLLIRVFVQRLSVFNSKPSHVPASSQTKGASNILHSLGTEGYD